MLCFLCYLLLPNNGLLKKNYFNIFHNLSLLGPHFFHCCLFLPLMFQFVPTLSINIEIDIFHMIPYFL